jgi:hypothetical protein
MSWWHRVTGTNFIIKFKSWEYWPFGIIQFPIFFYWFWLSLRSRSLLFFSASNPGITMGGMFGESKFEVIEQIPSSLIPKTILVKLPVETKDVLKALKSSGYTFPVIFKPDLGERGHMVRRINSENDIDRYLKQVKIDFLVQELVDLPLEFGIFYTRLPNQQKGNVTSVVMKEMLSVVGDGMSTLRELILKKERARLQWEKLQMAYSNQLENIIPSGKKIELVSIGNHALGTKFLDGSHLINARLSATFDNISKQIKGFYFGRFDLRCASVEDLYEGRVKILELNGCGAEPAHIYDPNFKLIKAVIVLIKHWRNIFVIARFNHKQGVEYPTLQQGYQCYKKFKAAIQ